MNDQTKGLLITTCGVLAVVPDALFVRLIDASPLVIAFWRNFLCGIVILTLGVLFFRMRPIQAVRQAGKPGIIFGICAAFSSMLFVQAIALTNVANAVFIIAAMPIFAAFYSWVWMGERLSQRMVWTIALVLIGLFVIGSGSAFGEGSNLTGDLMALLVAAVFSLGLTAVRKGKATSMVPVAACAYILCSLVLALFINPFEAAPDAWPLILLHGGVFIALSTCLFSTGPRFITSAEVALLILLESVLAPILVWYMLGEEPGKYALIGGAIVLVTLLISNLIAMRRRKLRQTIS